MTEETIAAGPNDVTVRLRSRKADRALHEEAAAGIEKLRDSLTETLWFIERYSNRWDGINGRHPHEVVEAARALLKHNTNVTGLAPECSTAQRASAAPTGCASNGTTEIEE